MDYTIWTKEEFGDSWKRQDAGDKGAAKRLILEEMKSGREPILTVEVPFDLKLEVGDPGAEVKKTRGKNDPPADDKPEEGSTNETDQNPPE